ncbi:MAG: AAA family ATPase [Gammaproteobacteria bacterium]|nr:AAA family ATPase [Gammaproteobacteria bacterium]MBU2157506.1 AAA family ATPase [Gammaproteobacteria bacterium]MBU2253356.1 AAA family ATPase [Gammaproteobacteria bacterium]MBU2321590.1 AAA family ATPase [Gammaproteobacteria bacterium]
MGKKSSNKFGPQQIPAAAPTAAGVVRASVEQHVAVWSASFESASKAYQSFDMTLDISVEREWLRSVYERFEGDSDLVRWIEQFATLCKELVRFKERLHDEYAERWAVASKLAETAEVKALAQVAEQEALVAVRYGLDAEKVELEAERSKLLDAQRAWDQKVAVYLETERSLNMREANAQAGFVAQNEAALRQLEAQQRQQVRQHEADLQTLREDKHQLDGEISQAARRLADVKFSCTEAEAERVRLLDQREHDIKQKVVELDRARSRLDREWADIQAEAKALQQRLDEEMASERANHQQLVAKLEEQRERAWTKANELKEQLLDIQELKQSLGEVSGAEILQQLEVLRQENRELKRSLEQSDTAQLQRDNDYLRDSKADLEREVAELRPERDELRRELSSKRVAATELEAVAREKRVLEQHKNTLAVHIDDLESRIEQLTSAQRTQTPFPAMSLMDSDRDYRARMDLDEVPDLETFATQLQHRIAKAEKHVELFYPIEDIRVLLGGLAMSQLHVFQGISGTGKTSLAKAFAKAMGGFCTDIAVQAGWRDRDDLLGHYNAFERRFYEKDCLQALYKAQTPRWDDTCNIILLDEMNLSRPEQYFAEFLSALEKNNPDERLISLSETSLPNAPAMLAEGRKIRVPANVWFIGTANHDETTNELADKTYDRAHVMTLPKQDQRFTIKLFEPANYSYRSLRKAFGKARADRKDEIVQLLKDLTGDAFTEQLGSQFELGWGNRFEKQALDFIPVMLACGASSGEALDHLLATRVMRSGKVTGRYNVSAETLRNLKGALEDFWISADLAGDPRKSMELLEADIRRLDGRG